MFKNTLLAISIGLLASSCQDQSDSLSDSQKVEIYNSAKETVVKVFEYSNNLDFVSGLNHYANDSNAYYISDGTLSGLDDLKKSYSQIGPSVEFLKNNILSWHYEVLTKDIISFTLPVELTLKLKGIPEFTGQLVWTAILQKRNGNWIIVQSHESWLNCAEVTKALTPS